MKTIHSLLLLILFACFYACKNSGIYNSHDQATDAQNAGNVQSPAIDEVLSDTVVNTATYNAGSPSPATDWNRKIIKNATLTLEVADLKAYTASLYDKIKQHGGYVASEEQKETSERQANELVIKVPVQQFEQLLSRLTDGEVKVITKNIATNDVSMDVVDARSRIDAKKVVRDRYLELIGKAKSVKEILAVENELNVVQEDMESASGRLAFLNHQSALSSITLSCYQNLPTIPVPELQNNFFAELGSSLKSGLNMLTALLLGILTIWPVVVAGVACWLYLRRIKSKKIII